MDALLHNWTWDLVALPKGERTVGCKWVLNVKSLADDLFDRYKARLVAKGFTQNSGKDFGATFVPVKCDLKMSFDIKDLYRLRYFLGYMYAWGRLASTPMVINLRISTESEELLPDPSIYQRLVGRLIYLTNTRPDLTFVVSVMRLFCFTDADYAGSKSDKYSTSGFCTFYGSHLISWKSKKQLIVSWSSAEPEYCAMAQGIKGEWIIEVNEDSGGGGIGSRKMVVEMEGGCRTGGWCIWWWWQ
ncbi:Reverse transcriptase, RNA-dependent DNA polymerase protein [Actinidia chinensis var. chinensis]|uniref:Reverse transcriptase, RNA-dependent DNA polymerase protein n=1 Tax=Actinidia chinensis var. chinensis TaxID=1590841 RepID=A0A2R6QWL5_ACTCC|nr:Reverse transcriptase, RNA-dependent DNA polymerase protein [Actinidia chinensis var. chinensis]